MNSKQSSNQITFFDCLQPYHFFSFLFFVPLQTFAHCQFNLIQSQLKLIQGIIIVFEKNKIKFIQIVTDWQLSFCIMLCSIVLFSRSHSTFKFYERFINSASGFGAKTFPFQEMENPKENVKAFCEYLNIFNSFLFIFNSCSRFPLWILNNEVLYAPWCRICVAWKIYVDTVNWNSIAIDIYGPNNE